METQVVEQVSQETPAVAPEQTPEVQAALYIQQALPQFRRQLEKVTGTQAKRVLSALVESPLEKTVPGFTTQEAEQLFLMGTMIQNAKFLLFQVALKDQEIAKEVEQAAVEEGQKVAQQVSQEVQEATQEQGEQS